MPTAKDNFDRSIKDAIELLGYFDVIYGQQRRSENEVLKRASLIMACTAWETYVEDRVEELVHRRLGEGNDSFQNKFVLRHLALGLKQFHNPTSEKTCKLFSDFLGVLDISKDWVWNHFDRERARRDLDALFLKRGEAVHRSRVSAAGIASPDLIRKDELEKAIRFLKDLVDATERATTSNGMSAR